MAASTISVETLAHILEQFLAEYPDAIVTEEGALLFDFATARYSLSGEGKCVLHLWSEERNIVRRVLDAEVQNRTLRLQVLRFGQSQPNLLEICGDRDPGNASSRRRSRAQYQKLLERVLRREYPGFHVDRLSSSPDLEHSISPVYTRGVLRAGQTYFAVLGCQRRRNSAFGRRRLNLRHPLDGLPAPALRRTCPGGRIEAVSPSGTLGDRSPACGESEPGGS